LAPDNRRRVLLASLLGTYTASLIPWALAQPVADADRGAFLALSALLAGRQSLDGDQAARLYDALLADDPGFPSAARKLLSLINERKIDPLQLQRVLDRDESPLAPLPRKVVTAWFMGVVGSGDKARVIAYEKALNAVIVSDVLKPPTYCYGAYASWTKKPA
jgi:hypothetical protein